jgi:hypothetical protein
VGEREEDRAAPPPASTDPRALLGYRIMARVRLDSEVVTRFGMSGALTAQSGAHLTIANAGRDERSALGRYLTGCS